MRVRNCLWIQCTVVLLLFIEIRSGSAEVVLFSVKEGSPVNSYVGTVSRPSNCSFTPVVFHGFTFDSTSGIIRTKSRLDRELQSHYDFILSCSEPIFGAIIEIPVKISVLDINDNCPKFSQPDFEVSYYETARIGTQVPLPVATDSDTEVNGLANDYSIVSGDDINQFRLVFVNDQRSPQLYLENITPLDRENVQFYRLNISVSDKGIPPCFAFLAVRVLVLDQNDHSPVFDHSEYSVLVNDSVPPHSEIIAVHASDGDEGKNALVKYMLEDKSNQFYVNETTGNIYTSKLLNCERVCTRSMLRCKPRSCAFVVLATDSGTPSLSGRAYVTVTLTNGNTYSPSVRVRYLPRGAQRIAVNSDTPVGTRLCVFVVRDQDIGVNGKVNFVATHNNTSFKLLQLFGDIYTLVTAKKFDQKTQYFSLDFKAEDQGTPSKSTIISVPISVNNSPKPLVRFKPANATFTVLEDAQKGSIVGALYTTVSESVKQNDSDSLALYRFVLDDTEATFYLTVHSGLLILNRSLNRTTTPIVKLNAKLLDASNFTVATTALSIRIVDINEPPVFLNSASAITVYSDLPIGSEFYQLEVKDYDGGSNGTFDLSVISTGTSYDPDGAFSIKNDGVISNSISLSQLPSKFYLTVTATDHAAVPLSSSFTFLVNVRFRSECSEIPFYPSVLFVALTSRYKRIRLKSSCTHLQQNTKFSFRSLNSTEQMMVNSNFGFVTFSRGARVGKYLINVSTDQSPISTVSIYLYDKSTQNLGPTFTSAIYKFVVSEGKIIETPLRIGSVGIKDSSVRVNYFISNGDPFRFFEITKSGQISCVKTLNREKISSFNLTVVAATSMAFATALVEVIVRDLNDIAPQCVLPQSYELSYALPLHHPVFHLNCFDWDTGVNSILNFRLVSLDRRYDHFGINRSSGLIFVKYPLLPDMRYRLKLIVSDSGFPSLSNTFIMHMITNSLSNGYPLFPTSAFEFFVPSSIRMNTIIGRVAANASSNIPVTYRALNHSESDSFHVSPVGNIYVVRSLNADTEYSFLVLAENKISQLFSITTVLVHSESSSSCKPRFSSSVFTFDVSNRLSPFSTIGFLSAKTYSNCAMSFHLIDKEDAEFLLLDPVTGEIKVTPYRSMNNYGRDKIRRLVMVYDQYGKENDTASIVLQFSRDVITDTRPKRFPVIFYLQENVSIGTFVGRLQPAVVAAATQYYRIVNASRSGNFTIGRTTGVVQTVVVFDFEKTKDALFTVEVSSSPTVPPFAVFGVKVLIIDQNDHPPSLVSSLSPLLNIPSNLTIGSTVFRLFANDNDSMENSLVFFGIRSKGAVPFVMNAATGQIIVSQILRPNFAYDLDISLSNPKHTPVLHSLKIVTGPKLRTTSHNDIKFPQHTTFSVPENATVGHWLGVVRPAQPTNQRLLYDIQARHSMFSVESTTGVIMLASALDFEEVALYTFNVTVSTERTPAPEFTIVVYVSVLDVNDNAPIFPDTPIVCEVPENVPIGSHVCNISATDADADENGRVSYSIFQSPGPEMFSIDKDTGMLLTAAEIDRELENTYEVFVRAVDNPEMKNLQHSVFTKVVIKITDINDNQPLLVSNSPVWIREDAPTMSVVTIIQVNDIDNGVNGTVKYHLEEDQGMFELDPSTGTIRTLSELDRETKDTFNLTIIMTDLSSPPLSNRAILTVNVLDVNDNPPKFDKPVYVVSVPENATVGTTLTTISAVDDDTGGNAAIAYRISSGDSSRRFSVNRQTGEVSLLRPLDYETQSSYSVIVTAIDYGFPPLFSNARVQINVEDLNDFKPVFPHEPIQCFVQEKKPSVPYRICQISAIDKDGPENSVLTYSLRSAYPGVFSLNERTGVLSGLESLDREFRSAYHLEIEVSDSGEPSLTGTAKATVSVLDINDNPPVPVNSPFEGHVTEGMPPNTKVLTVIAEDLDERDGSNSDMRFSLRPSTDRSKFDIHPYTGVIYTRAVLDREDKAMFYLQALIEDAGIPRLTATANVLIYVDDINDSPPVFTAPGFDFVLPYDLSGKSGTFVGVVTSLDSDLPVNAVPVYFLSEVDSENFVIDKKTGMISSKHALSKESYTFSASVQDQLNSAWKSRCTVSVRISRQISPLRQKIGPSVASVAENSPVHSKVTRLAFNPRILNRRTLNYTIISGNEDGTFYVTKRDEIRLAKAVDYERRSRFDLWILVELEELSVRRTAFHFIAIEVLDRNDNAPVFNEPYGYTFLKLPENTPIGTSLVSVKATDADKSDTSRYKISSGSNSASDYFSVDEDSGSLSLINEIDREKVENFRIELLAIDSAGTISKQPAIVRISVTDINDNGPRFLEQYFIEIPENTPVGTELVKLRASDTDLKENSVVTFSIRSGNNEKLFYLDSKTGRLFITRDLDYETAQQHVLNVLATDQAWSVETHVTIQLLDVNDEYPIFSQSSYTFTTLEQTELPQPAIEIGTVSARDRDQVGPHSLVTYTLSQSEFITIDSQSGTLYLTGTIKYSNDSLSNPVKLFVTASDHGEPPLNSTIPVLVFISDANDHSPRFSQDIYRVAAPSYLPVNTPLLQVLASDNDTGENANLTFSIRPNAHSALFKISPTSGWLSTNASLARHLSSQISFSVVATDSGIIPLSSSVPVIVSVTTRNFYSPEFSSKECSAKIAENRHIGSEILTLKANDRDDGLNGVVMYKLDETKNDDLPFALNKNTGVLSSSKMIDFELKSRYYVDVIAYDLAYRSQESTLVCTIEVIDIQDEPPVFSQGKYVIDITENSNPGVVFNFTATDADSVPDFKVIEYELVTDDQNINELFTVDESTGALRTYQQFDAEAETSFKFTVKAFNPGTSLQSTVPVFVQIIDVNEFQPRFVQKEYEFHVSEDVPVGSKIGYVSAVDEDCCFYGRVNYHLTYASIQSQIGVNRYTGELFTTSELDRESYSIIELHVTASNPVTFLKKFSDTARVLLRIGDANDAPTFVNDTYQISVSESVAVGSFILQVKATDVDAQTKYSDFVYRLENDQTFSVHSSTGVIRSQVLLDRESQDSYNLTVLAVDFGVPPKTGSATVLIQLLDVNDGKLTFSPSKPVGYIAENSPAETRVISVANFIVDADLPENHGPYAFELKSHADDFLIDEKTGVIYSLKPFDREKVNNYTLGVTVREVEMTASVDVTIVITDINDNPPTARDMNVVVVNVKSEMDSFVSGEVIADVSPEDKDVVGDYSCQLLNSSSCCRIGDKCQLIIDSFPPNDSSEILRIKGTDGLHDSVEFNVKVSALTVEDLQVTTVIGVVNMTPEAFLSIKDNFLKLVIQLTRIELALIGIETQNTNNLYLFLYVIDQPTRLSRTGIASALASVKQDMEDWLDHSIITDIDPCWKHNCSSDEVCSSVVAFLGEFQLILTKSVSYAFPKLQTEAQCDCSVNTKDLECEKLPRILPKVCENEGRLEESVCVCPGNFTGDTCTEDVNECDSGICLNGGLCQNLYGSYKCSCLVGFSGANCEQTIDHCSTQPCFNGSTCISTFSGATCECVFGRFGSKCERNSYSFGINDAVSWVSADVTDIIGEKNNFRFHFATTYSDALLLTLNDEQESFVMALYVKNGSLAFSTFQPLAHPKLVVLTSYPITDGLFHKVSVSQGKQKISISVDGCTLNNETCYSEKTFSWISIPLLKHATIGSLPNMSFVKQHGLPVSNLVGCVESVLVNGLPLLNGNTNLRTSHHNVDPTCKTGKCTEASCSPESTCVTEWFSNRCSCLAQPCQSDEFTPISFDGSNSYVEISVRPLFKRNQMLTTSRRKRSVDGLLMDISHPRLKLEFVPTSVALDHIILHAVMDSRISLFVGIINEQFEVWMDGVESDSTKLGSPEIGLWHTLTVWEMSDSAITVDIFSDESLRRFKFTTAARPWSSIFIGGSPFHSFAINNSIVLIKSGFKGCVRDFTLDGSAVPFSGQTEKYQIRSSAPGPPRRCDALLSAFSCDQIVCPVGEICVSSVGLNAPPRCMPSTQAAMNEELVIILAVIVPIALVLVVIAIFLACRRRRNKRTTELNPVSMLHTKISNAYASRHGTSDDNGFRPPDLDSGYDGEDGRDDLNVNRRNNQQIGVSTAADGMEASATLTTLLTGSKDLNQTLNGQHAGDINDGYSTCSDTISEVFTEKQSNYDEFGSYPQASSNGVTLLQPDRPLQLLLTSPHVDPNNVTVGDFLRDNPSFLLRTPSLLSSTVHSSSLKSPPGNDGFLPDIESFSSASDSDASSEHSHAFTAASSLPSVSKQSSDSKRHLRGQRHDRKFQYPSLLSSTSTANNQSNHRPNSQQLRLPPGVDPHNTTVGDLHRMGIPFEDVLPLSSSSYRIRSVSTSSESDADSIARFTDADSMAGAAVTMPNDLSTHYANVSDVVHSTPKRLTGLSMSHTEEYV